MGRAMEKVKELTPRRCSLPLEKQIARVNQWYRGWSGYYSMTETPSQLKVLEAHIRARFRAQFMRDQKRRRYLRAQANQARNSLAYCEESHLLERRHLADVALVRSEPGVEYTLVH